MGKPTLSIKSWRSFGWVTVWWNRVSYGEYIAIERRTRGTETSQYPEEKTSTEIPLVVASERGPGQWFWERQQKRLERRALAGDSPVCEINPRILE
jgi:hypothetical protein